MDICNIKNSGSLQYYISLLIASIIIVNIFYGILLWTVDKPKEKYYIPKYIDHFWDMQNSKSDIF